MFTESMVGYDGVRRFKSLLTYMSTYSVVYRIVNYHGKNDLS